MYSLGFQDVSEQPEVELSWEGRVPDWLRGSLFRNGPASTHLKIELVPQPLQRLFSSLQRYCTQDLLLRRQAPYPLGHGGFSRVGTLGVSGKVIVTCRLGNRVCAAGALDAYAACGNSDERAVADG